jgi:EPS-associated MarR family transcriptional regulator
MYVMASRRAEQQESARFRVMRLLSGNPRISTREVADAVGISNGSAFYVLKALVEKGFVKLESFSNSPFKIRYAYLLTPKGIREKSRLTQRFIKIKRAEFEELRIEIRALEEEVGKRSATEVKIGYKLKQIKQA